MGQKQSFILGGLGLIPFILILIACAISPPNEELYGGDELESSTFRHRVLLSAAIP